MKNLKEFQVKEEEKKQVKGGPAGYPRDFYGGSYGGSSLDDSTEG